MSHHVGHTVRGWAVPLAMLAVLAALAVSFQTGQITAGFRDATFFAWGVTLLWLRQPVRPRRARIRART